MKITDEPMVLNVLDKLDYVTASNVSQKMKQMTMPD